MTISVWSNCPQTCLEIKRRKYGHRIKLCSNLVGTTKFECGDKKR